MQCNAFLKKREDRKVQRFGRALKPAWEIISLS